MTRWVRDISRARETGGPPPRAKKSLGQHFLVDRRVLGRIVKAAEPVADDVIVEIGPGRGVLTAELAKHAGSVVAVELDPALVARLEDRFATETAVEVVAADARDVDFTELVGDASYKVVANLPYYAAMPIVRRFLESDRPPTRMVVMLQREVAEVMTAEPGSMTLLSVAVQLYGRPAIVCSVPPRAFRPPPKVASAVIRIDLYAEPALALDSVEDFFRVVRSGFSAPRKMIRNSLRQGLATDQATVDQALAEANIASTRRPGTLSLDDWGALYRALIGKAQPTVESA